MSQESNKDDIKYDLNIIVFGGTGLTGDLVVRLALKNNMKVIMIVRRQIDKNSYIAKEDQLEIIQIDFEKIEDELKNEIFSNVDCVISCLGTTINDAKTKKNMTHVEIDYNLQIAEKAKLNNVSKYILVTSQGANVNSYLYYFKTKGKIEEEVIKLNFKNCIFFRPSLLIGQRKKSRFLEGALRCVMKVFGQPKVVTTSAEDLAKAILIFSKEKIEESVTIIESKKIHEFAKKSNFN